LKNGTCIYKVSRKALAAGLVARNRPQSQRRSLLQQAAKGLFAIACALVHSVDAGTHHAASDTHITF